MGFSIGIFDLVGLAATLMFAVPVGVYGLNRLLSGAPLVGGFFVVVAALMIALPQRLTTPQDLPGKVAELVVGAVVPEEEE
ncbi:MAG: hypothetical protein ABEJ79_05100 [Halolamina sp.]